VILLDTHVVVWLASGDPRLTADARSAIQAAGRNSQGLAISSISIWALALLVQRRRIRIALTLDSFLHEVEERFVVLPITARICAQAVALPESYPRDPADRIIGATAIVHGISLVTADRELHDSPNVSTIW